DAAKGLAERADRLHGAADDDGLAVGHAAFQAAGVVGVAGEAEHRRVAQGRVEEDLIVHLATGASRALEAQADLYALEGLDAHDRGGDAAIEAAVPSHARAEAYGCAEDQALDDAAGGV